MRELSLFTGTGGGVLASRLLGWRTIGYVEFNDYRQRLLRQRIDDGCLDRAPLFGDIRAFLRDGYAESYSGLVDVVSAGFPCQPFSVAGKQLGEDDERNMWPETIECLRVVRPRWALLENVSGLFAHEYARTIFRELAESGFDAAWRVLSAAELGAPHKRDRVWIVAHANEEHRAAGRLHAGSRAEGEGATLAAWARSTTAHADQAGREESDAAAIPAGAGSPAGMAAAPGRTAWWQAEPGMGRVADGVAHGVDRLEATGDGQVPAVAAAAWQILSGELMRHAA